MQPPGTRAFPPRLLWSVRMGRTYFGARPKSLDERVFAWDANDILIVLDALTGSIIERHPIPGRLLHKPPAIDEGKAFLCIVHDCTAQTAICAYDLQQCRVEWLRQTGGEIADLVVSRDHVFWITREGVITAANKKDGASRWSHRLRRPFSSPHLVDGGRELYVGAEGKAAFGTPSYVDATEGYVLALDSLSGDLRWIYCTGGEVSHPPVLAGERIYVGDSGSEHRHIYCLSTSPKTRLGEQIWRYDLGGLANCGTLAGEALYWGCYDHHLYALDAHTGTLRWRYRARGPVANYGPPCVAGDWVFATGSDGYLYGLDARNGSLRWKYFVSGEGLHEPEEREPPLQARLESTLENVDAELQREEREWLASMGTEAKDTEPVAKEEASPSPPDLLVWNTRDQIFLLADDGLLHCFTVPREQQ